MKSAAFPRGLLAVCCILISAPALGQRIRMPTTDGATASAPAATAEPAALPPTTTATPAPSAGWVPTGMGTFATPVQNGGVAAAPSAPAMPAPAVTYGAPAPPSLAPTAPAPGAATFGPAPMATLNGNIQPAPANWDPYAPPAPGGGSLLPQDPYLAPIPFSPGPMVTQMQKFLRDVSLDYHWFAGHGSNPNQLGINDIDLSASFNLPFLTNRETPLVITPGFAFHFWDGPQSTPPLFADMPPQTFDAYLDSAWNPQVNEWFGGELDARVGVYSDFRGKVDTEMFRITGKGLAVLTLSPAMKLKAGVWYLDRVRYKLLPTGGLVWSPNPDIRFDILFPNPRFTQRLTTLGTTEWWWYMSGDYGGGTWVIKRSPDAPPNVADQQDLVDYNDMRVALGLEFKRIGGFAGWFEAGYSFQRELVYRSLTPATFRPDGTFFLRSGFMF